MATQFEPTTPLEKEIAEILGSAANKKRVAALVDLIEEPEGVETVGVRGARVPVETVEAYGLTIRVDANGRAAEISSEWGLEIIE